MRSGVYFKGEVYSRLQNNELAAVWALDRIPIMNNYRLILTSTFPAEKLKQQSWNQINKCKSIGNKTARTTKLQN